jgi:hypothetical protein
MEVDMTNSLSLHLKGGKLTSLSSKEEEKKKQKPMFNIMRQKGKGGDPFSRKH